MITALYLCPIHGPTATYILGPGRRKLCDALSGSCGQLLGEKPTDRPPEATWENPFDDGLMTSGVYLVEIDDDRLRVHLVVWARRASDGADYTALTTCCGLDPPWGTPTRTLDRCAACHDALGEAFDGARDHLGIQATVDRLT